MPGGRPTSYSEEVLTKAKEYLSLCKDESVVVNGEQRVKTKLPTRGGLARYLDVSRDTLYEWAKVYPQFSDIIEDLSSEQEDRLINNGLSGDYNPTIAKVLLAKQGYSDKQEIEQNTKIEATINADPKLAQDFEEFLKTKHS